MNEQNGLSLVADLDLNQRQQRQVAIGRWTRAAFGDAHAESLPHRGLRMLEEAIELAQALGCDREQCLRLVNFVFSRPVGQVMQEMGGVGVTLLALGEACDVSVEEAEKAEVIRVLLKPLAHFAKRNQEKDAAGFSAVEGGAE